MNINQISNLYDEHSVNGQFASQTSQQTCSHSTTIKEFVYGAATGNFICLDCKHLLLSDSAYRLTQINV